MEVPIRSEEMSEDQLYAQDLLCPDCGRHGIPAGFGRAGKYVGFQVFNSLNLEHCEGCRRVLRARGGGTLVAKSPMS